MCLQRLKSEFQWEFLCWEQYEILHENNTKYYIYLYRFDWRFINKDSLECVTHQSKAQDIFMIIITYRLFNGMPTGILWPNKVRSYTQIIFKQYQYWRFKDVNRLRASYKLNRDKDVTIEMKKKTIFRKIQRPRAHNRL